MRSPSSLFSLSFPVGRLYITLAPCAPHSLLNSVSRITDPHFLVKHVSSRESSHKCMSSLLANRRMGGLSSCRSICLPIQPPAMTQGQVSFSTQFTVLPSKCPYHKPFPPCAREAGLVTPSMDPLSDQTKRKQR